MLLQGLHINGESQASQVRTGGGYITAVLPANQPSSPAREEPVLPFENAVALPGLINSHDHLDFNLFPQLGTRIYSNYIEWGADIQHTYQKEIKTVLQVPISLRIQWGLCKNLLSGITTVVHHGKPLAVDQPPIDVFQSCYSLHSVNREKYWRFKLNNPFARNWPYVIHTGEGTDAGSHREINQLLRWNLLNKKLVAIHGVAMNEVQAGQFSALVWCPASNYFLLNETAAVDRLKKKTRILFGTDSTLTGHWNLWEQLRTAAQTNLLTEMELTDALTRLPAATWDLNDRGTIEAGKKADLVIVQPPATPGNPYSLFQSNPENLLLVVKNGEPVLFDECLLPQLKQMSPAFHAFTIGGVRKYIRFNLPALLQAIQQYLPDYQFPVSG